MPQATEDCRFEGGPLDGQTLRLQDPPPWYRHPEVVDSSRVVYCFYRRDRWDDGHGNLSYAYVYRPPGSGS